MKYFFIGLLRITVVIICLPFVFTLTLFDLISEYGGKDMEMRYRLMDFISNLVND